MNGKLILITYCYSAESWTRAFKLCFLIRRCRFLFPSLWYLEALHFWFLNNFLDFVGSGSVVIKVSNPSPNWTLWTLHILEKCYFSMLLTKEPRGQPPHFHGCRGCFFHTLVRSCPNWNVHPLEKYTFCFTRQICSNSNPQHKFCLLFEEKLSHI